MVDRLSLFDDLALADRRIARAEDLVVRLSKLVADLDPASRGAEVGRQSLELMRATLASFRTARDHLRRRLDLGDATPEAVTPGAADTCSLSRSNAVRA